MTRDGREQAMMFLRPVDVFGDIAVLTGIPYPGTVTALEACERVGDPRPERILDLIPAPALTLALAVIRHLGAACAALHHPGRRPFAAQRRGAGWHAPYCTMQSCSDGQPDRPAPRVDDL